MSGHSLWGASSMHRWMRCPGSIRLSREIPPDPGSGYAREGTIAHAAAEQALHMPELLLRGLEDVRPADALWVEDLQERVPVAPDMWRAVEPYVRHCRALMGDCAPAYWVEHRVSLNALLPGQDLYGRLDFCAYHAETATLHIVDLKYGRGQFVTVEHNAQLQYYALAAVLTLLQPEQRPVRQVVCTVVQPRYPDDAGAVVRSWTLTLEDLLAFGVELVTAYTATLPPDAPLVPGTTQCRWCPAIGVCPAVQGLAVQAAQTEFTSLTPSSIVAASNTQLAEAMQTASLLEQWIARVRSETYDRLTGGEDVPGWKLVQRRKSRHWADPTAIMAWMAENCPSVPGDAYCTTAPVSVAQMERLARKVGEVVPPELIISSPVSYVAVPEQDPRAAVAAGERILPEFSPIGDNK